MKILGIKKVMRLVMVVLMAMPLPEAALAANVDHSISQKEMVSTDDVLKSMAIGENSNSDSASVSSSRNVLEKDIREFLKKDEVKSKLKEKGLSSDEISSRLAGLSDSELKMMSGQIQEARAGGDILVTVLLIVLIIYFIKRI